MRKGCHGCIGLEDAVLAMGFKGMLSWLAVWLAFSSAAFAGSSLVLSPRVNPQTTSLRDPLLPANQSWRVEFQLHDWTLPSAGDFTAKLFELDGTGANAFLYPTSQLALGDLRDNASPAQPCFVSIAGLTNALVRIQRDLANSRVTCEAWNYDGTGYNSQTVSILSPLSSYSMTGGRLGASSTLAKLGFLRISTALLPLGSKPPTTADGGNWTELKFDNNLNDSSGNQHSATVSSPSYVSTPNQVAIALPKTYKAPAWSNWVSLRAGFPAQLDGTASYSLSDASSSVNYFWQQVAGPSIVKWSSREAATPTITGLIFGTYTFSLRVTDSGGSSPTTTLQVGAVAYDNNGVVINANANADRIFGPMIAFGQNPWGWMDQQALLANTLQAANNLLEQGPPSWATPGQGTVAYSLIGIGPFGQTPTTLTAAITASATSISIADASKIPGLASLPTWVLIGNGLSGGQEVVRITASTATSGPATLTVGYDGRGVSAGLWSNISPPSTAWAAASSHASGDTVGEFKITGSGTLFHSDSTSALCPVGIPGPVGQAFYSNGTVMLIGGSATITGSGTQWQTQMGAGAAMDYYVMWIHATHAGGTAFNWWAQLVNVGSETSTTWSRPLPSDVDAGPFSYVILKQNAPVLQFADRNGTYNGIFESAGCESETKAFAGAYFGFSGFTGPLAQSGKKYSYDQDTNNERGIAGAFGANFYGTGLAQRALYFRSGLNSALTNANLIDDYWIRHPRLCGGFGCFGLQLTTGGGIIGAFANLVTNPNTKLTWPDVRKWASNGSIGAVGCNAVDTRDSGYQQAAPALAALFDPDATYQNTWHAALQAINTRDNNCRTQMITSFPAETNSWANSFLWNNSTTPVTLTTGSATGTGSNIAAGLCDGIETGTATVTLGSAAVAATSGSFSTTVTSIVLGGRYYQFTRTDATHGNLSALWPGPSGSVNYMTRSTNLSTLGTAFIAFGMAVTDVSDLQYNHACIRNSATQITLDRPWTGANGTFYPFQSNLAGYNQQPYMLGIKTMAMNYASALDSTLSTNFGSNAVLAGAWEATYGLDYAGGNPALGTLGMSYARVAGFAESGGTQTGAFTWKIPGATYGLQAPDAYVAARELNQEAFAGFNAYYMANPTPASRALGDAAYGAIWCQTALTTGVYCDAYSAGNNQGASNLTSAYLGGFKWTGYFFGVGMAHQWPAVRVGGVAPARNRTVNVDVNLGTSASARILITAPSGASTSYPCAASGPCAVTVDDRQGSHWFQIQYLSSAGAVQGQSDPDLLAAAP